MKLQSALNKLKLKTSSSFPNLRRMRTHFTRPSSSTSESLSSPCFSSHLRTTSFSKATPNIWTLTWSITQSSCWADAFGQRHTCTSKPYFIVSLWPNSPSCERFHWLASCSWITLQLAYFLTMEWSTSCSYSIRSCCMPLSSAFLQVSFRPANSSRT